MLVHFLQKERITKIHEFLSKLTARGSVFSLCNCILSFSLIVLRRWWICASCNIRILASIAFFLHLLGTNLTNNFASKIFVVLSFIPLLYFISVTNILDFIRYKRPSTLHEEKIYEDPIREVQQQLSEENVWSIKNGVLYDWEKFGFQFTYPNGWFIEDGLLSPRHIEYFATGANNAPIKFGVYSNDNTVLSAGGDIFSFGNYEYMIEETRDHQTITFLTINDREFRKYEFQDYGRLEGDSVGKVVLFIAEEMIHDSDVFIVWEWNEYPAGKNIEGNSLEDFYKIVYSFE